MGSVSHHLTSVTGNMDTSIKCIKYTLFLFNLLFTLSGLFLIVTGGVVQGAYSQYLDFLGDQFFSTSLPCYCGMYHLLCCFLWLLWGHQGESLYDTHILHPSWYNLPHGDRSWYCSLQVEIRGQRFVVHQHGETYAEL